MVFGKIDYINLLPFHIFLKKSSLQNAFKQACECKKAVPSAINKKFKKRSVDAAVISSIESQKKSIKTLPLGIVAQKHVRSVIVKRGVCKNDPASATSNVLANILGIEGEVFIGDRALKLYLQDATSYVDLAQVWHNRFGLPFVFARLSINKNYQFYKKLAKRFLQQPIKIPQYILKDYALKRDIKAKDIKEYLTLISYKIDKKEQRGLKLFLKKARQLQ